jgi:uncharacterized protein with FMN-binding domain
MIKKKYVVLIVIVGIILAMVITTVVTIKNMETKLEQLALTEIPEFDLSTVKDGIYNGSYKVFPVAVEVNVTVKNHAITDITLIKHTNGQGKPAEVIIDQVISKQSLQVDSISGATYSSKVILKAIENALNGKNN